MVVLLALVAIGAAVHGLTGALVGYVIGMVASAALPEKACEVPPRPPVDDTAPTPEAD